MGQLLIERRNVNGQIREDGLPCNEPRNQGRHFVGDTHDYDARVASFRTSPYREEHLRQELAGAGFYYTGYKDVVKCCGCGQCVEDFNMQDNPNDQQWHRVDCEEMLQNCISGNQVMETSLHNFPQEGTSLRMEESYPEYTSSTVAETEEDPGVYEAFACLDPFTPGMANSSDRARTFYNNGWDHNNVRASPEDIARAGFMYAGMGDRTRCWYCNGCLENWGLNDDPWEEHAKWFPNCEHILRHRGPNYVHEVVSRFRDLQRPMDEPPQPVAPQLPTQPVMPQPFTHPAVPQPFIHPVVPQPSLPALPRAPVGPRIPRHPVALRLPQPPAPPIPPTHSSQNSVQLPGGITLSLTGGIVSGSQPAVQVLNNSGGHTFTVRTRRGTVITYNYGGSGGGTFIQMGGSRRNRQPPEFVDPRQEEQKHLEQVNNEMTNSPIVADIKSMGFDEETIRIVLLSKFLADGKMFESVDDLLETLTQYQQELARIESPQTSEGASSSPSTSNQEQETGTSSTERELRRIQESRNCRLCHRELATVVLMPCAHLAVCLNCAARNIRVCPVCKRMVSETIRSYIS